MNCNCIDMMNEALDKHNARLSIGLRIDLKTGKTLPPRIDIPIEKVDKKKRGRLPFLFASFCPFCGQKYEDEKPDTSPFNGNEWQRIASNSEAPPCSGCGDQFAEALWVHDEDDEDPRQLCDRCFNEMKENAK